MPHVDTAIFRLPELGLGFRMQTRILSVLGSLPESGAQCQAAGLQQQACRGAPADQSASSPLGKKEQNNKARRTEKSAGDDSDCSLHSRSEGKFSLFPRIS